MVLASTVLVSGLVRTHDHIFYVFEMGPFFRREDGSDYYWSLSSLLGSDSARSHRNMSGQISSAVLPRADMRARRCTPYVIGCGSSQSKSCMTSRRKSLRHVCVSYRRSVAPLRPLHTTHILQKGNALCMCSSACFVVKDA